MPKVDFRLYVITNRLLCGERTLTEVIGAVCRGGVKAIQLREKDLPAKSIFNLAREIQQICKKTGVKLMINDRFDIAQAIRADGVHLTSKSLPIEIVRKYFNSDKLVGVSTHSLEEARQAEVSGADFALFGPIYPTPSKAAYGDPQGLTKLQEVAKSVSIPVFAVGGITPDKAKKCVESDAFGVAVISSVMSTRDISATLKSYEDCLGSL
ncbi:MAG: thiamine phosphate synthase [Caldithrix sp.]|nr:MAG: thiamine phosphate synthase [Caldithrix sp.]